MLSVAEKFLGRGEHFERSHPTSEGTTSNGHNEGNDTRDELSPGVIIQIFDDELVSSDSFGDQVEFVLIEAGSDENRSDTGDPGGDSVQVVHSADVHQTELLVQEGADVGEAEGGDVSGDHTDQNGDHGHGDKVGTGTDSLWL